MDEFQLTGRALIENSIINCSILIREERIIKISKIEKKGVKNLKFNDEYLILPSLIDLHVHFRDWNQKYKETIRTGSLAALAGGVTTVLDMPNTSPLINDEFTLLKRIEDFKKNSLVDFGIHTKPPEIKNIEKICNIAFAIKFYEEDLKFFPFYKNYIKDKRIVIHAQFKNEEFPAVKFVLENNKFSNLRFAHISKKESIEYIKKFKEKNKKIFIEVTPHHIFLSLKDLEKKPKGYYTVRPPLASKEDNKRIIDEINNGIVDFIATDHAPHTLEEKLSENPPPGFANLEIVLPLCLTFSLRGQLNFYRTLNCLTKNPAKYLGIKKGEIKEKNYADIVVVNVKKNYKIDSSKFFSLSKFSPFDGKEVIGKPILTIIRGKIAFENDLFNLNIKPKNIFEL